jgi:pyridoxal phosphate enzyme (YggS family)
MTSIPDRVADVRERVSCALARSGRPANAVTIVAVTKTFPVETVRAVIDAGISDIGENRVQELIAKAEEVARPCRWHLVGSLQRNKATKVVGLVHLIHSIDGVDLARTVDRIGGERGVVTRVLLEVNTSGEATKHGVAPDEARAVADALVTLPNLDWQGLMTIGPAAPDPARTRVCFRELVSLADDLRARTGRPLPHLSMGMSDDFETAIEEGATLIRLGRVITGERGPTG